MRVDLVLAHQLPKCPPILARGLGRAGDVAVVGREKLANECPLEISYCLRLQISKIRRSRRFVFAGENVGGDDAVWTEV